MKAFFSEEKKQKTFSFWWHDVETPRLPTAPAKSQKSFGSFLQKRTLPFYLAHFS
jgi:hypothetical protein